MANGSIRPVGLRHQGIGNYLEHKHVRPWTLKCCSCFLEKGEIWFNLKRDNVELQ